MLTSRLAANNDGHASRTPTPHSMHRVPFFAGAAAVLLAGATPARGQGALGVGPDATLAPAGALRVWVTTEWDFADSRFGSAGGKPAPFGAALSLDTLGVAVLPALSFTQDLIRQAAAHPGYTLSLGTVRVTGSARRETALLAIRAGLTRWLQLDVAVPYVRTTANVLLRANPTGLEGNVGTNPALVSAAALAADTALAQQMARAARAVEQYCAGSGSSTTQCSGAGSLAADAGGFASTIGALYGTAAYVPTRQSAIQSLIDQRAAALRARLNEFAAIQGSGVPAVTAASVVAADPLASPQVQAALGDRALGLGVDPVATVSRSHFGDIEVGATVRLLDTFGPAPVRRGVHLRAAAGAGYRLPTGQEDAPANIADIGTGTHTGAVTAHAAADVQIGGHFWTSVAARATFPRADVALVRVAGADSSVYAPVASTATLRRERGVTREITVAPRWSAGGFFTIGGIYRYESRAADTYVAPGQSGRVLPAIVGLGLAGSARQVGAGIAFSNLAATAQGRGGIPLEASYEHLETVAGSNTLKNFTDRVTIRAYVRLWGR